MERTSITILQEYLQKNRLSLPFYELIRKEGPDHETIFTIRVTCGSFVAEGKSFSKKAAKHNAAIEMIKLLNKQPDHHIEYTETSTDVLHTSQSPIVKNDKDNLCDSPSFNSVGKLQELCDQYKLKAPIYEESSDISAKGFTIRCKLNKYVEEGSAFNKKKAKQNSAEQMRQRLIKMHNVHDNNPETNPLLQYTESQMLIKSFSDLTSSPSTKKAKEIFPHLKNSTGILPSDKRKFSVADCHLSFSHSFDPATIREFHKYFNNLKFTKNTHTIEDLRDIVKKISDILNISISKEILDDVENNKCAVFYKCHSIPLLNEIGIGSDHNDAERDALFRIINVIRLLLL